MRGRKSMYIYIVRSQQMDWTWFCLEFKKWFSYYYVHCITKHNTQSGVYQMKWWQHMSSKFEEKSCFINFDFTESIVESVVANLWEEFLTNYFARLKLQMEVEKICFLFSFDEVLSWIRALVFRCLLGALTSDFLPN